MSHPPNDNPWQDERGQNQYSGHGYQNPDPYSTYQDQTSHPGDHSTAQPNSQLQGQYSPPEGPPPQQQQPQPQRYYQTPDDQSTNPWGAGTNTTHTMAHRPPSAEEIPPNLPPRRTATDMALPTGQDRSHQIEVMQSYEAAGRKDEDDQNVELLQREFPNIDGSLIAAIYGDSKSLSATREMLGELGS